MTAICDLPFWRPTPRGELTAPVKPDPLVAPVVWASDFKFSGPSVNRLVKVKEPLQDVANLALKYSVRDFGITEGMRTLRTQKKYVADGRSQTLNSKHLTGDAIDVKAFYKRKLSWDMEHYLLIANAFVYAASELGTAVRWGGAWHVPDIRAFKGVDDPGQTMQTLYAQTRKRQGRKVFIDAVHFELA